MKLIFLGAPGAGKGTQAEYVCKEFGIPSISTGNILREAIAAKTELGLKAKSYMDGGNLVPDEVVISIIAERLKADDCKGGFLLDGFPRTIPQAEALDRMGIYMDKVVSIEVPDEAIVERMSGRRACLKCGATYHVVNKKPAKEGVCDNCGNELVVRTDDKPETVLSRLNTYHEQTEPLKDFYKSKGCLVTVDGTGSVSEITELILAQLR